ncbi:hypothetical protein FD967_01710 [Polynucleobacter sp. JS-Mosq-20-D10]|uniref:hypothetical protein n=1 Tax=Polynucleobacter sp. JS-Mosq-20-D10 TaxID=2576922 RepID=UPI001BFE9F7E|nr:hypothetical protein [Polynucleobacter sp. JS-Mosq-20-D10]QWE00786.1 hypothetical protein FD967_01710 [Polynucleobacter sp. JS-Mosq-20-D10]
MSLIQSIVLVGSNSFVAKKVFENTDSCKIVRLCRPDFNIDNELDYFRHKDDLLNASHILYFIANISNNEVITNKTNVESFGKFIRFLEDYDYSGKLVFLSTLGVVFSSSFKGNSYIQSKAAAEILIQHSKIDWRIIRLTFPFGKGESGSRLFSRILYSLENNIQLNIDNLIFFATPLDDFKDDIYDILINKDEKLINLIPNNILNLHELVNSLSIKINSKSIINYSNKSIDLIGGLKPILHSRDVLDAARIINIYRNQS